jgi:hypothetical protein
MKRRDGEELGEDAQVFVCSRVEKSSLTPWFI